MRATILLVSALLSSCVMAAFPAHAAEPAKHAHAMAIPNTSNTLRLGGELTARSIDAAALGKFARHEVTATAHGVSGRYEGVNLIDVLADAGAPTAAALRGKALGLVVRITAADGYQVVYSLAELDAGFRGNRVLLVDRADGVALGPADGPFRLVAPDEARPGRWVRQVTAIDLVRLP